MRFSSDKQISSKLERASLLALALAALLVRGGERIALVGDGHRPTSGRAALNRLAREWTELPPSDAALPPDAPVNKHAQLVWLSDFLSPPDEIEAVLRRFARAGLVGHLVHLIDPAEEDFPYAGRTRFESVTGKAGEIFGRAEAVRDAYRRRFHAQGEAVLQMARRLGWSYLAHRTDKRPETALVALYADLGGPHARQVSM